MNKKQARDALDIYKKFLIRMDRVADFLKVAEVWRPNSKACVSAVLKLMRSKLRPIS
jgi:hypothetical protein